MRARPFLCSGGCGASARLPRPSLRDDADEDAAARHARQESHQRGKAVERAEDHHRMARSSVILGCSPARSEDIRTIAATASYQHQSFAFPPPG